MEEDDMGVYQIPGLTHSSVIGVNRYLAFTKTRAGNPAFFDWYVSQIVIPTVRYAQDFYQCTD
jgi:hypothetical protein